MSEAQAQFKVKPALKHQSPKMKDHLYSSVDKVLVWREKIINYFIVDFAETFTVLHHDERSKIIAIDQNGIIKR